MLQVESITCTTPIKIGRAALAPLWPGQAALGSLSMRLAVRGCCSNHTLTHLPTSSARMSRVGSVFSTQSTSSALSLFASSTSADSSGLPPTPLGVILPQAAKVSWPTTNSLIQTYHPSPPLSHGPLNACITLAYPEDHVQWTARYSRNRHRDGKQLATAPHGRALVGSGALAQQCWLDGSFDPIGHTSG